jgi:hypothetical protein
MKSLVAFFREFLDRVLCKDQEIVLLAYKPKDEEVWHEVAMQRWQVKRFVEAFREVIETWEVRDEAI